MALSEPIFMKSFYNSHAEFHENPRGGLVANTTSQTDRYVIVHIRHSSFTSYETPKNSVRIGQSNTASTICIKWGRLLREVIPLYFENNTKVVKKLEEMRRIAVLQG